MTLLPYRRSHMREERFLLDWGPIEDLGRTSLLSELLESSGWPLSEHRFIPAADLEETDEAFLVEVGGVRMRGFVISLRASTRYHEPSPPVTFRVGQAPTREMPPLGALSLILLPTDLGKTDGGLGPSCSCHCERVTGEDNKQPLPLTVRARIYLRSS
jgi:hypothetical protein